MPETFTALDLRDWLAENLGLCGCTETSEYCMTVLRFLEWAGADMTTRSSYSTLYKEVGIFYLIAGCIEDAGLIEHGSALRHPWLTEGGKRVLFALKQHSADAIDQACDEAYN